jgi:L-alanine-DL-glutamate epimerase-like enolase superfamily enzyme
VDAALWDLEAKLRGQRVWDIAGVPAPGPVVTAFTVVLDTPGAMAEAAAAAQDLPLLKAKLGSDGPGDLERIRAVRAAAPRARLIVDANEGWTVDELRQLAPPLADLGVEMVEQPIPAGMDEELRGLNLPLPLCADESCIDAATIAGLRGKYDAVNVKLDKAGGLTEALEMAREARRHGLDLMVGCMLGTSLAMAPALLLAGEARWTDLDGPLLLARDREHALRYENGRIDPPEPGLWG